MTSASQILLQDSDVHEIMEAVNSAFLHLNFVAGSERPQGTDQIWSAWIGVTGSYDGTILLRCSRRFAHAVAQEMFGSDGELSDEAARDALAELTNVIGGNLKALLSAMVGRTCTLSLPTVVSDPFPCANLVPVQQWCFRCADEQVIISVLGASLAEGRPLN